MTNRSVQIIAIGERPRLYNVTDNVVVVGKEGVVSGVV